MYSDVHKYLSSHVLMIPNVLLSYKFPTLIEKITSRLTNFFRKKKDQKEKKEAWIRNERITRPNTLIYSIFIFLVLFHKLVVFLAPICCMLSVKKRTSIRCIHGQSSFKNVIPSMHCFIRHFFFDELAILYSLK